MTRSSLLPLLFLLGCQAGETGIIVAVSGSSVDELEFNVAAQQDDGSFLMVQQGSGQRYSVRGRNLRVEPYEHLLREEPGSPPLRVRVLVLGIVAGKDRYFAIMEPPQAFIQDEMVRRALTLISLGDSASVTRRSSGCYRVWHRSSGKSSTWVLAVPDDGDCDGHKSPADCKDDDGSVYPGADELCDGKDNNCDGKLAGPTQLCFARDAADTCREGTRGCDEAKGGGLAQECSVSESDPRAPAAFCEAYAHCSDSSNPPGCTEDRVGDPLQAKCTAELNSASSTLCGGSQVLEPPQQSNKCRWEIVDSGGWKVGLGDGSSQVSNLCQPKLSVEAGSAAGGAAVVLEFFGDSGSEVINAAMTTKAVTDCGANPFSCVASAP